VVSKSSAREVTGEYIDDPSMVNINEVEVINALSSGVTFVNPAVGTVSVRNNIASNGHSQTLAGLSRVGRLFLGDQGTPNFFAIVGVGDHCPVLLVLKEPCLVEVRMHGVASVVMESVSTELAPSHHIPCVVVIHLLALSNPAPHGFCAL
jgi:hypothetical protein